MLLGVDGAKPATRKKAAGLGFSGMPSIGDIAAEYVERAAALDPFWAGLTGIAGHDHEMPDLSADGFAGAGRTGPLDPRGP